MIPTRKPPDAKGRLWIRIGAVAAVIFGAATIREGSAVLLGNEQAVQAAGNYVPFVLWFNTLAGFAYVAAGIGLWLHKRWGAGLAVAIAAATLAVSAAFGAHVAGGGAYELRTVVAMSLRSIIWLGIALVAWRLIRSSSGTAAP